MKIYKRGTTLTSKVHLMKFHFPNKQTFGLKLAVCVINRGGGPQLDPTVDHHFVEQRLLKSLKSFPYTNLFKLVGAATSGYMQRIQSHDIIKWDFSCGNVCRDQGGRVLE
jgi:hypothetical protein